MAEKKDVLASKDFLSDRISTQVRTIAVGVLATSWLFLIPSSSQPVLSPAPNHWVLLVGGGLCLLTLLVDYFQYLFGYIDTTRLVRKMEKAGDTQGQYDYDLLTYKLRGWCFWAKQVLVILAFLCLTAAIAASICK